MKWLKYIHVSSALRILYLTLTFMIVQAVNNRCHHLLGNTKLFILFHKCKFLFSTSLLNMHPKSPLFPPPLRGEERAAD